MGQGWAKQLALSLANAQKQRPHRSKGPVAQNSSQTSPRRHKWKLEAAAQLANFIPFFQDCFSDFVLFVVVCCEYLLCLYSNLKSLKALKTDVNVRLLRLTHLE